MADTRAIEYVEVLAAEGAALISAVRAGPADALVDACPGWDVLTLAGHIGTTWRWSAEIVNERLSTPAEYDPDPSLTADRAPGWLEAGLVEVLDALSSCPPDEPVWGFGLHPRTAAFWQRRQVMETAVHRIDAELATRRLSPVAPEVAADGVSEFIEVLLGRLYRGKEAPAGQLKAITTDTGDTFATGDPAGGVASLTGRAEDVFLVLWNRRGIESVETSGDPAVLKGWRDLGGM